eukprot:c20110_g3_i1 orf=363-575(-)
MLNHLNMYVSLLVDPGRTSITYLTERITYPLEENPHYFLEPCQLSMQEGYIDLYSKVDRLIYFKPPLTVK